jgi:hypothetical protein
LLCRLTVNAATKGRHGDGPDPRASEGMTDMKTQSARWATLVVVGTVGTVGTLGCGVSPGEDSEAAVTEQSAALKNLGTGALGSGGGVIVLPPDDPDVANQKPRKPLPPSANPTSASGMAVSFVDRSSYETGFHVYRGPDFSGPWTLVATLPASAGLDGTVRFNDSGLTRDTEVWYLIGAFNGYGESYSVQEPGTTLDGRGGVARIQLQLHTSSVSDANTDDDVHVALNYYEENHGTYMDYGRNDFERGDDFTYDLTADDITDLSQLNELYIFKTGTDGWCFDKLTLLVNGKAVYDENRSSCQWLDDENGNRNYYIVSRAALRAHPLWQAYTATIPSASFPRLDLATRLEGYIGNMIHQMPSMGLSWAGGAQDTGFWVKITKKDETAVHAQFRLGVNQSSLIPGNELESTIGFDIRFTGICRTATTPPKVVMAIENPTASVDISLLTQIETLGIINFFTSDIEDGIAASFPAITRTITLDNRLACAMPTVASDGSVGFDLSFRTTTGGGLGGLSTGVLSKTATAVFAN